jgi:hypothetical protein
MDTGPGVTVAEPVATATARPVAAIEFEAFTVAEPVATATAKPVAVTL